MTRIKLLLAVAWVAAAFPAFATNGMRMIGFGPVQDSMGGVGVGATLDSGAMVSNPAGLADLDRRLDVGGAFFKPTVDYNATGIVPQQIVVNDGQTVQSNRGGSPIPAIAVVYPLTDRLTTGIGLFGAAGMGVDYVQNLYGGVTLTSYLQGRLTPSIAYKLTDDLSAGLTVNVMFGQMKYDVASGAGQALHDTATSMGIGATLGVKYTPVKMLSFGAAWETRSYFHDFSFTVPSRPNPFAPGTTIPGGTDKLSFDQPQVFTIGMAIAPLAGVDQGPLVIAADVQWINWADTMGSGLPQYSTDPNTTGAMPFNMNWHNQWVFKFGTQVAASQKLQIRAGYNYGMMPLDPARAFENLAFPAVSEHHLTAGFSYAYSKDLSLNVAAMYAFNASLSGANAAPPPPMGGTGQGIAAYTTSMSQWEADAGIVYHF